MISLPQGKHLNSVQLHPLPKESLNIMLCAIIPVTEKKITISYFFLLPACINVYTSHFSGHILT